METGRSRRSGEEQVEGMYHVVAKGEPSPSLLDVRLGASTTCLRKTLWSVVNLSPVIFLCLIITWPIPSR